MRQVASPTLLLLLPDRKAEPTGCNVSSIRQRTFGQSQQESSAALARSCLQPQSNPDTLRQECRSNPECGMPGREFETPVLLPARWRLLPSAMTVRTRDSSARCVLRATSAAPLASSID